MGLTLLVSRCVRHGIGSALLLATLLLSGSCRERPGAKEGAETASSSRASRGPAPPFNVVLVSVDTLRADHLSLYGYERPTSPHLDALAEESVVFDQFVMNGGFTLPSHMTMMTSLLPTVHGISGHHDEPLPEARITLAEQLREAGWATAGFVDGGYMRGLYGFDQGFDSYDDSGGHLRKIFPKADRWLRERAGDEQPFFLFLHTYDLHARRDRTKRWANADPRPYSCPAPFPHRYVDEAPSTFTGCRDGLCANELLLDANKKLGPGIATPDELFSADEMEYIVSLYDGCINYVDEKIAELADLLRELGLYDRTLLVVTSDHGEEFLDHGMLLHKQPAYEEMARIPLLMKLPGSRQGGSRITHLAAMIDLMPTILDVVDVPLNPEAQGRSLLPTVVRDRPLRRETTVWRVLRTERWKYFPEERLLFDLENDPGEKHDRYEESPEIVARFEEISREHARRDRRLTAALEKVSDSGDREVHLTDEQLEELRALGYID